MMNTEINTGMKPPGKQMKWQINKFHNIICSGYSLFTPLTYTLYT